MASIEKLAPKNPAWDVDSWRTKPIKQQPIYPDAAAVTKAEKDLSGLPPLVSPEEIRQLKKEFRRLRTAADRIGAERKSKKRATELSLASMSMVHMLVNHIHKENRILFPLVQKFLTKDALPEVARRML